jgi:hypothetical protein
MKTHWTTSVAGEVSPVVAAHHSGLAVNAEGDVDTAAIRVERKTASGLWKDAGVVLAAGENIIEGSMDTVRFVTGVNNSGVTLWF